jgi:hypothetical protein
MHAQPRDLSEENKRLQRCINDLVSVLALPAMWSGGEPSQIVRTLLEALLGMLQLDLVYLRLKDAGGEAPIEMVRFSQSQKQMAQAHEIGEVLSSLVGGRPSGMACGDTEAHWGPRHFDGALGTGATG